jgi:hypothetical protein
VANGDKTRWWSQTKNAVVAWTLATIAVLLAIAFGIVASIQCIELQSHHLVIPTDSKGPNWAEITTASLTALLVVAAFRALGTIREARHARTEAGRAQNALQMNELSRRWDEETNLQVRRKVHEYAKNGLPRRLVRHPTRFGVGAGTWATPGPDRLKECIMKLQEDNDPEYRELLTEPNFLEDLAILVQRDGIDFEIVNQSLGATIAYRWSLWQPTVDWRRELRKDPRTFCEFEDLAKRIAKENPDAVKVDAAGEIIWEEFRE